VEMTLQEVKSRSRGVHILIASFTLPKEFVMVIYLTKRSPPSRPRFTSIVPISHAPLGQPSTLSPDLLVNLLRVSTSCVSFHGDILEVAALKGVPGLESSFCIMSAVMLSTTC
jgi:hypothetical protein